MRFAGVRPRRKIPLHVRVNVDEPGREHPIVGVDDSARLRAGEAPDARDPAAAHADVRAEPRRAAPVDDARFPDEEVERLRRLDGKKCEAEENERGPREGQSPRGAADIGVESKGRYGRPPTPTADGLPTANS